MEVLVRLVYHWVCPCSVYNSESREHCLNCGLPRAKGEYLRDHIGGYGPNAEKKKGKWGPYSDYTYRMNERKAKEMIKDCKNCSNTVCQLHLNLYEKYVEPYRNL